jgi:hypothetical protein
LHCTRLALPRAPSRCLYNARARNVARAVGCALEWLLVEDGEIQRSQTLGDGDHIDLDDLPATTMTVAQPTEASSLERQKSHTVVIVGGGSPTGPMLAEAGGAMGFYGLQ